MSEDEIVEKVLNIDGTDIDYSLVMKNIIQYQKDLDYLKFLLNDMLPACEIVALNNNTIALNFAQGVSHSVSIISELLNIDSKMINDKNANKGVYFIHVEKI